MLPDCDLIKARLQQVLTHTVHQVNAEENASQITQSDGRVVEFKQGACAQLMQT
jgi:alpha-tubulin suppressor-like RCC1 family protein